MKRFLSLQRNVKEEIANTTSHAIGVALSIIGLVTLIWLSVDAGDLWKIIGVTIYGITLITLYLASTLYHGWLPGKVKQWLQVADHAAIYLLIAGTYTPFTLVVLPPVWGWTLCAIIWALALTGVIFKIFFIGRFNVLSTILYLIMGWLVVVAMNPLIENFSTGGLSWLVAGGLFYSLGTIFYLWEKLPYSHVIWHLFVMAGSICHFFSILLYVIPMG